jgi:hypothetical protein
MGKKKKGMKVKDWVENRFKLSELKSQNKLLGGPTSAARQIRGARATGHSRDDVFYTSGDYDYLAKKGKKKAEAQAKQRKANEKKRGH